MTLRQLAAKPPAIPTSMSWYLADLGEARGKQELFKKQSPQRLRVLREHALIESAISSNRIEGVEVDQARIGTILFGKSLLRDRNEEEVRGYRDALKLIHEQGPKLPVSEETIRKLHSLSRGGVGDAGQYKDRDSDIVETFADGRRRVRFKTVTASSTPAFMKELIEDWDRCLEEGWIHPLIALAAFNLDFLCIHPFRDGNGRVSRLLLLLACYHLGYEVGRYISLERVVEANKERYYETLQESSGGWHEGLHDPWPYAGYLFFIVKAAYREFEERVGQIASPRGSKTELVVGAVDRTVGAFRIADLQRECPGVSLDLIRRTLKGLRDSGRVECLGRGQFARWQKTPKWQMGNTQSNG